MPVRETSIEVYNRIKEDGTLSKKRFKIYSGLFEHGPATSNELFRKMYGISHVSQANIQPVLGELVKMGCVAETKRRTCDITGETVIEYDVTSRYPVKLKNRKKRIVKIDADQFADDLFSAIFMGPMVDFKPRLNSVFLKHLGIPLYSFFQRQGFAAPAKVKPQKQMELDL